MNTFNRYVLALVAALTIIPLLSTPECLAQDDPVLMTIAGQPVLRSEFEYSYNKNNTGGVIDKKTVEEYVDLFVNYKLKVAAALDAKLDTLTSFQKEFRTYRDQQIRPTLITEDDLEKEAVKIYNATKESIGPEGLIRPWHIFIRVSQSASEETIAAAKVRIDSIYSALQAGADFAELAKAVSQDPASAKAGGDLEWQRNGMNPPEFEKVAFAMQPGETSEPFMTPYGYHIIYMSERKQFEPFEYHHDDIISFINRRNINERIIDTKVDSLAKAEGIDKDKYMDNLTEKLTAEDSDLKNLIREYHDGLLLYEISNINVWNKAAKDDEGLAAYFNANKDKYSWDEPRFKGMAYHVKVQEDVKAVRDCVKKLPFNEWADALKTTFNNDSIIRIRVEKGIFKKGDNGLVDREQFGVEDAPYKKLENYPIDATYGKLLKKGPEEYTDVRGLVTADYQEELEKAWVEDLRTKYAVKVNEDVLKTVNNH